MTTYAIQYTYGDDAALADAHRPEHREFLRSLHERGPLLLSGPLGGRPGGLLVLEAESEEAALELLAEDPFLREGVIVEREAREWNVVIGELPAAR